MGRIDVSTDDKGLGACFDAANITAEWKGLYMSYHKVITLDDFVYMIDSTAWEKSLESPSAGGRFEGQPHCFGQIQIGL